MTTVILFSVDPKSRGEYEEFSNFHPCKLKIDGVKYATTEHYFQSQKFVYEGATPRTLEYARIIATQSTPYKTKILGKQQKTRYNYPWAKLLHNIIDEYSDVEMNPEWDEVKNEVMRKAIICKFTQNPRLRELLLSTTAPLIENNRTDPYWGCGPDGNGLNTLGKILSEVRESMR